MWWSTKHTVREAVLLEAAVGLPSAAFDAVLKFQQPVSARSAQILVLRFYSAQSNAARQVAQAGGLQHVEQAPVLAELVLDVVEEVLSPCGGEGLQSVSRQDQQHAPGAVPDGVWAEEAYHLAEKGGDRRLRAQLVKPCLLYTSPSPRD